MNEENQVPVMSDEELLASLKAKADLMGITYHPSIGYAKLLEKVQNALDGVKPEEPEQAVTAPTEDLEAKKRAIRDNARKLIRVNITCMNPAKKDWESEIIAAGNSAIGTFKRCVPFNTVDGTHVEQIILDAMRDRMCQVFYTETIKGNKVRRGKQIREFAIEVLPQLTKEELQELARRQAMRAGSN